MRGVPRDMVIERCCSKGVDRLTASAVVEDLLSNPLFVPFVRELEKKAKAESLLKLRAELDDFRDGGVVPCVEAIDLGRFLNDFVYGNRPILFKNLASDIVRRGRWTFESLKERFGTNLVSVTVGPRWSERPPYGLRPTPQSMFFRDFIDQITINNDDDEIYLTAEDMLLAQHGFESLLTETELQCRYLDPTFATVAAIKVWIGPKNTLSRLHHDRKNSFLVQLLGKKQVTLCSSATLPRLHNNVGCYSAFSFESGTMEKTGVLAREVMLDAGDALFLPIGWWHEVKALEAGISVTYDNVVGISEQIWGGVYWIRNGDPESLR
jgi:hypothetical protein